MKGSIPVTMFDDIPVALSGETLTELQATYIAMQRANDPVVAGDPHDLVSDAAALVSHVLDEAWGHDEIVNDLARIAVLVALALERVR